MTHTIHTHTHTHIHTHTHTHTHTNNRFVQSFADAVTLNNTSVYISICDDLGL